MDPAQIAQLRAQAEAGVAQGAQQVAGALAHVMDAGAAQMTTQRDAINTALGAIQQHVGQRLTRQQQQIQQAMDPIQDSILQSLAGQQQLIQSIPLQQPPPPQPLPPKAPPVGASPESFNPALFGELSPPSGGFDASQQAFLVTPFVGPLQTIDPSYNWNVYCNPVDGTPLIQWDNIGVFPLASILFTAATQGEAQAWVAANPSAFTCAPTGPLPPPPGGPQAPQPAPPSQLPPSPEPAGPILPAPPANLPADWQATLAYLCHCLHSSAIAGRDPVDFDTPLAMLFGEERAKWHAKAFAWVGVEEDFTVKYPDLNAMIDNRPME